MFIFWESSGTGWFLKCPQTIRLCILGSVPNSVMVIFLQEGKFLPTYSVFNFCFLFISFSAVDTLAPEKGALSLELQGGVYSVGDWPPPQLLAFPRMGFVGDSTCACWRETDNGISPTCLMCSGLAVSKVSGPLLVCGMDLTPCAMLSIRPFPLWAEAPNYVSCFLLCRKTIEDADSKVCAVSVFSLRGR